MSSEILILISIVVSLIILKKSWDYDAFPWGLMLVVGFFGFLFFGVWGLFIGIFVVGAIINFGLSLIFRILSKIFDIGLIRKKDRILIAKGFLAEYRNEIFALFKKYAGTMDLAKGAGLFSELSEKEMECWAYEIEEMYSDKKIIGAYSRYINEIYAEANKLENPIKRHKWDLGSAELRENFVRGGQKWIEKPFMDSRPPFLSSGPETTEIKKKFVEFCEDVIFDNPERVGIVRSH